MTVVARAPVRLSFGGGGTDLPAYYERRGGLVVSAAITRYAMAVASPSPDGGIGVNSADYRIWLRWPAGTRPEIGDPLPLPRAVVGWFSERQLLPTGVDLFLASEVPPGSGLGSSSAMVVAIIAALSEFSGSTRSRAEIADLACRIEIDRLGRPIGKQDQYAAALGGLNAIAFSTDGVEVEALTLPPGTREQLEQGLMLFSTGLTRDSASILSEQRASTIHDATTVRRLDGLKDLAVEMRSALETGDLNRFGELLDRGWRLKRGIHRGISSDAIDRWYAVARDAGALGGKIAGAGGGGFLLLYAPPAAGPTVTAALLGEGLDPLGFRIDHAGVEITSAPFGAAAAAVNTAGGTSWP